MDTIIHNGEAYKFNPSVCVCGEPLKRKNCSVLLREHVNCSKCGFSLEAHETREPGVWQVVRSTPGVFEPKTLRSTGGMKALLRKLVYKFLPNRNPGS